MEKNIESFKQKCLSCGGNLIFDPNRQDLICENCNSHYAIDETHNVEYHNLQKKYDNKNYEEYISQNKIFKCPNCGANVVLNKFEISQKCPYCSTSLVIQDGNSAGMSPDAIIPFAFDEAEAKRRFLLGLKKKFWVPNGIKKHLPENEIAGIYIPAFGFDTDTKSKYSGELYEEHTYQDSDGVSHTERTYFQISGNLEQSFQNIMVESSSKITQSELNGFLPYKFLEKKPFDNSYILGYSVEQYNSTVDKCIPQYKDILNNMIKRDILRKYTYDGVRYLKVETDCFNEKYLYHLLPVYRFDYKYKSKDYITYMNGQTGKVDNNVPKSGLKIAITIILTLLILALPIVLGILFGGE